MKTVKTEVEHRTTDLGRLNNSRGAKYKTGLVPLCLRGVGIQNIYNECKHYA